VKRQRRKEGDVVEVDLGDGSKAFARVLPEPLFAFYDLKAESDARLEAGDIVGKPVLWRIWVMNKAITTGRWRVIGNMPLEDNMMIVPTFFKEDPIGGEVSLYQDQIEYAATPEQCIGVERAAVWDPEHAEDRLRDHFGGRPNKWVRPIRART
jgi:hypothetical protein